jgi:heme-degrading monooxygenase HmoA
VVRALFQKEGDPPMFARVLEVIPKAEKKEEMIKTIRLEVLPLLKKEPGFIELMPLLPEAVKDPMVVVSLWNAKRDVERYVDSVFPKVEQILRPFLAVPVTVKTFAVEATICRHLIETLTQAA